ncbi:MAG: serine/threonine protein kinase [Granulosicoccaceae bacterium]|jgi:Ser/Thr protein kinase RdoA (MazF antagonist)
MNEQAENQADFSGLQPGVILDAVERYDLRAQGGLLALNSYENRVYRVDIEAGAPVVVKFYRPARWSDEGILEEHSFTRELYEQEIPVVAPLPGPSGSTLEHFAGFRYAVFPCQGGRATELNTDEDFRQMGRFIGRMHAVGRLRSFRHRPDISIEEFGHAPVRYLLEHDFIPPELHAAYTTLVDDVLQGIEQVFARVGPTRQLRLHGDCHLGNVLWTDDGPHIVDLDDCRNGPAVQDLWMLLSGDREAMTRQVDVLLEGYTKFCDFNAIELGLIEALRSLRMIHYAAWLARRWQDPAFPRAFPWFNTPRYWEEHILSLREQFANLGEPPLQWWGY